MKSLPIHILTPPPVEGRTFSLFADAETVDGYYRVVDELLDMLLAGRVSSADLLRELRRKGKRKGGEAGKRTRKKGNEGNMETEAGIVQTVIPSSPPDAPQAQRADVSRDGQTVLTREELEKIEAALSRFTMAADAHISQLPLLKRRDRVLAMPRRSYHLAMLETALVNRMQRERFAACDYRIALLPHCLRDLTRQCKAEQDGLDLRCRKCSQDCFIRHISDLLEEHGIEPYLWMELGRRALFRNLRKKSSSPGVLGIACVPELLAGMRLCLRENVAVVGVPLNANRCTRWMGEFHPNSISLEALERLLQPS